MTTDEFRAAGIRYEPGRYRDCPWCQGRGCPACDAEAEKDFQLAFPDGVKPLATYATDDPAQMAEYERMFGLESLEHAFGPGGGGMAEVFRKLGGG